MDLQGTTGAFGWRSREGTSGSGWTSPEAPGEESLEPNREGPTCKEAIRK